MFQKDFVDKMEKYENGFISYQCPIKTTESETKTYFNHIACYLQFSYFFKIVKFSVSPGTSVSWNRFLFPQRVADSGCQLYQVIPGNLQKYVSTNRNLLQCKTLPAHFSNNMMVHCLLNFI